MRIIIFGIIVFYAANCFAYDDGIRFTPDGKYVVGTPTCAPDGSYVGGNVVMLPDGTYGGDGSTV